MNRAISQQSASGEQFARAEMLARSGKAGEAVQVAREISERPDLSGNDRPGNDRSGNDAFGNDQFGFRHLPQSLAVEHNAEALQLASLAVLVDERRHLPDDLFLTRDLTEWSGSYRMLGQLDRGRDLLDRAEK
jgi:hypothetical protein